jgi:hypothetical protein
MSTINYKLLNNFAVANYRIIRVFKKSMGWSPSLFAVELETEWCSCVLVDGYDHYDRSSHSSSINSLPLALHIGCVRYSSDRFGRFRFRGDWGQSWSFVSNGCLPISWLYLSEQLNGSINYDTLFIVRFEKQLDEIKLYVVWLWRSGL